MNYTIHHGNCVDVLPALPAQSVQCCVSSPPYFGLRDYGHDDQIGLEETPAAYVENMVAVFREVWRVLADDGVLWLNLGDSYAANRGRQVADGKHRDVGNNGASSVPAGFKPKDLLGIPWRVAFALQDDGWYLRSDVIWHKPNPMPESVRDRPTKAHEYLFLFAKQPRYYYDHEAIKEPSITNDNRRPYTSEGAWQMDGRPAHQRHGGKQRSKRDSFKRSESKRAQVIPGQSAGTHRPDRDESDYDTLTRNKRSVWSIPTRPYKGAHFAVMPPDLIEPCILAGSRPGDTVLDPFSGSGTVGAVALKHNRQYIGIELNPDYIKLSHERIAEYAAQPMLI